MHKVHYQPKAVSPIGKNDQEAEAQYGCYKFVYGDFFCGPMTAYRNKWEDWTSFWFYHNVPLDPEISTHPLVVKQIQNLPLSSPSVDVEESPERQAFVDMLHEVKSLRHS